MNSLLIILITVFYNNNPFIILPGKNFVKHSYSTKYLKQKNFYSDFEFEILTLVNLHRKSLGKNELKMDETIYNEAKKHTETMAKKKKITHDGYKERMKKIREKIGGSAGAENCAYGYNTAEEVLKGWIDSKGHRENMEGNYTLTAISAIQNKDGTWYYTQIFLKK